MPSTNSLYWQEKLTGNMLRDERHRTELATLGWDTLTVWECEIPNHENVVRRMVEFIELPIPPNA